ncbi:hypothetical protein RUND412_002492 [Rhizina undulata]
MYNRRAYDSHRSRTPLLRGQPTPPPPPPPPPPQRTHSHRHIHHYGYIGPGLPLHGQPNYDPRSAPPPSSSQFHSRHTFYQYGTLRDEHRAAPPNTPPPLRRYYDDPFGRRPDSTPPSTSRNIDPQRFPPGVYREHNLDGSERTRRLSRGPGERRPGSPDAPHPRNARDSNLDYSRGRSPPRGTGHRLTAANLARHNEESRAIARAEEQARWMENLRGRR